MNAISATMPRATTKKPDIARVVECTVLLSFLIPIGFVIEKIVTYEQVGVTSTHTQGDYILMLTSCLLGLLVAHLPLLLAKVLKMEIPPGMRVMYSGFLFCAIFLGEVMSFYYRVAHWDDILHLSSGIMIGLFGSMLVTNLCKTKARINLPPVAVAVFCFCFAICVGAVWEIFEFSMDALLGLNMQKTMLQSGEELQGHLAVVDTMKDIIVDTCGSLIASIAVFFSFKRHKEFRKSMKNTKNQTIEAGECEGEYAA